jgi:hypothetical protein
MSLKSATFIQAGGYSSYLTDFPPLPPFTKLESMGRYNLGVDWDGDLWAFGEQYAMQS